MCSATPNATTTLGTVPARCFQQHRQRHLKEVARRCRLGRLLRQLKRLDAVPVASAFQHLVAESETRHMQHNKHNGNEGVTSLPQHSKHCFASLAKANSNDPKTPTKQNTQTANTCNPHTYTSPGLTMGRVGSTPGDAESSDDQDGTGRSHRRNGRRATSLVDTAAGIRATTPPLGCRRDHSPCV